MTRRRVALPVLDERELCAAVGEPHVVRKHARGEPSPRPWRARHAGWSRDTVAAAAIPIDLEYDTREAYIVARNATVLAGTFDAREDVPRVRGECPAYRPCDRLRCRLNMYRQDEPPGRPAIERVPRTDAGYTRSVKGDLANGRGNPPRIDSSAPWLTHPPPPSCALDVAASGAHSNIELARAMGLHRTLAAKLVKRALAAYRDAGGTAEGLQQLSGGETESPTGNLASAQDHGTPNSPAKK